jgi:hypothetical protein
MRRTTVQIDSHLAPLILVSIALAACGARVDSRDGPLNSGNTPILLFNGTGTSPNDVVAVEIILDGSHLNYSKIDSGRLNEMDPAQLGRYRLLIVPGGNFIDIGNNLSSVTTANIRGAIENGLNYLGICAGAFFAGDSGFNGLNLTSGIRFPFYSAERRGIRKTSVKITGVGMPTLDQYWEDGPQLTGWGAVVGKYPDGTPAVVQGTFGSGWVILTGIHPEAPASWRRRMTFSTPVSSDNAYAELLIRAALDRESLAHY